MALTFVTAFAAFVGLDLVSGRAISRLADDRVVGAIALGIFLAALFVDVIVLARRRTRRGFRPNE